jgi:hypothetical protein
MAPALMNSTELKGTADMKMTDSCEATADTKMTDICVDGEVPHEAPQLRRSHRKVKERRLTLLDAIMEPAPKKVEAKRKAPEPDTGSQSEKIVGKGSGWETGSEKTSSGSTASAYDRNRPIKAPKASRTGMAVSEDPWSRRRVAAHFKGVMAGCRGLLTQIMIHKVRMWPQTRNCVSGHGCVVQNATLKVFWRCSELT